MKNLQYIRRIRQAHRNPAQYKKGFVVPLLIAIIALLVIGGGIYVYENKKTETPVFSTSTQVQTNNQVQQQTNTQTSPVNTQTINSNSINTSNWKTYTNSQYNFSIQYPNDAQVKSESKYGGTEFVFMRTPSQRGLLVDIGTQDTFRATPTQDQCDKKDGVQVNINGVSFYSGDVSMEYSGMSAGNYATQYCTIKNGVHYKLISLIPYTETSSNPSIISPSNAQDLILNQMLSTFKFTPKTISPANVTLDTQSILNLNDASLITGGVRWSGYQLSVDKNRIIFGDLDGDGVNEAIAPVSYCAGSCGMSVYVFKLYQGKIILTEIPETSVAGAAQDINSLQIKNGLVVVTETDFSGTRTNSYRIQLVNGKLVSTSL